MYLKQLAAKRRNEINNILLDIFSNYKVDYSMLMESKSVFFYYCYPEIFCELFEIDENNAIIEKLNAAGYLIYSAISINDTIIDFENIKKKGNILLVSNIANEEGIKLLCSIFNHDHEFWQIWKQRKLEYLSSMYLDKSDNKAIELDKFEKYADNKSSFGKVAIDVWYYFSGKKETKKYEALINSHSYFSVGFQIMDDILDFKVDIEHPQINIAHNYVNKKLIEEGKNPIELDVNTYCKYLYATEAYIDLVNDAIEYYQKAKNAILNYEKNLKLWTELIDLKIFEAKTFKLNIESKLKLKYEKHKQSTNIAETKEKNSLEKALELSLDFIFNSQNSNGSWEDFVNNAGISNLWVSGFVNYCISEFSDKSKTKHIELSNNFLIENSYNNLWGYNSEWIPDIDSSTCVLLALKNNNQSIDNYIEHWFNGQKEDGGFTTYTNEKELIISLGSASFDVSGWMQSHNCVSALAFLFLTKIKNRENRYLKLKEYLLSQIGENHLIKSYWWTSPIYTTSLFLSALILDSEPDNKIVIENGIKAILKMQNQDGSFNDDNDVKSPFYTAMVVDLLCNYYSFYKKELEPLKLAIKWLLKVQNNNGSFDATYCLRVPSPSIKEPNLIKEWHYELNNANMLINDIFRVFSTSTVYKALSNFKYNINVGLN